MGPNTKKENKRIKTRKIFNKLNLFIPLVRPKMLDKQTTTKQINRIINSVKELVSTLKTFEISKAINGKETPIAKAAPEIILIMYIRSKIEPANLSRAFFGFAKKIPLNVSFVSEFLFMLTAKARAGIV